MAKLKKTKTQSVSRDYLSVLESFWDARPQTAIERLSKIIADEPNHPDKFKLYRLWIEVLAQQGEHGTLKSLIDHLHLLSVMEPEASAAFVALRGIGYFEVDNFDAASLCFKMLQNVPDCDYCSELKFLVSQRISTGLPYSDLVGGVQRLDEYFHLKIVGIIAQRKSHAPLLEAVLKRVNKLFPKNPLFNELKFHTMIENGEYLKAANTAKLLVRDFPGNHDYAVFAGYASLKAMNCKAAVDILERAIGLGGDKDLDVLSLLLTSYEQLAVTTNDDTYLNKAERYMEKFSRAIEENGMVTYNIENEVEMQQPNFWMAKITQSEFFNLRDANDESAQSISHEVDEHTKVGDLVMLVADDYTQAAKKTPKSWRLVAVYQVSSSTTWNPIDGYQAELQLVSRPEQTIPFDIRLAGGVNVTKGIINLDVDALDTITDAVSEYTGDEGALNLLNEIKRVRLIS